MIRIVVLTAFLAVSLTSAPIFSADKMEADEPFTASIECQFHCAGQTKPQTSSFKQTFSPVERGLHRGNGNYWGVLGWNIWTWGREWCLEKAVVECSPRERAENRVARFSLLSLSSRQWELREPIDCRKHERNLPSPYWDGTSTFLDETIAPASASKRQIKLMAGEMPANSSAQPCKHPVKVTLCYGDCLVPLTGREFIGGDPVMETLASPYPNGTDNVQYCADSFVLAFAGGGYAPEVLQHYCENYVWNRVMHKNRSTAFCAATRISTDCAKLAETMK